MFSKPAPTIQTGAYFAKGTLFPNTGVYLCDWQPQGLKEKFHLFAAPTDLLNEKGDRAQLLYHEALHEVSLLRQWHGANGGHFNDEHDLIKQIAKGDYAYDWFIPPFDVLAECLKLSKDPVHKGTFGAAGNAKVYWSSSVKDAAPVKDRVPTGLGINVTDGKTEYFGRETQFRISTRPMRALPVIK